MNGPYDDPFSFSLGFIVNTFLITILPPLVFLFLCGIGSTFASIGWFWYWKTTRSRRTVSVCSNNISLVKREISLGVEPCTDCCVSLYWQWCGGNAATHSRRQHSWLFPAPLNPQGRLNPTNLHCTFHDDYTLLRASAAAWNVRVMKFTRIAKLLLRVFRIT